jgi:DNA-binding CsgD family transcriptional regulator
MTMKDLARTFGIHRVTVSAHLRQHGVSIRGQGLDAKHVPEAAHLYEDGWFSLRLAEKFGVTPNTVLTALRNVGVQIRPGQGGPPRRQHGRLSGREEVA